MTQEHFLFVEKYRPKTVDECILPTHIKSTASAFVAQGDLPHMLLSGGPGMGKTTLALAMCRELGADTLFINASEENGIDTLRIKIKEFAAALSFDGKRKYIILDEADMLTAAFQTALRGVMEEMAANCGFVLTCNFQNRIIPALISRCTVISFAIPPDEKKKLMAKFLQRLQDILKKENIQAEEALLIQVIKRYWPDLRRMLNEIQRAGASGVLEAGVLGQHADVQFAPFFDAIKTRNYKEARTWIGQNDSIDAAKFYRTVFDWLHEAADETTMVALIVLTADYQFRHLNAIDSHVHLAAFALELMHHGQYK